MQRLTDDAAVMLCLAALAYRGVEKLGVGSIHPGIIGRDIGKGLTELSPAIGGWDVVWGPGVYRPPVGVPLDASLMYVAQDREKRGRYVVVIRGTNPVSAFDWVFGDFWAGRQVPWPSPTGAPAISLSTALGLNLLQGMRSDGPRQGHAALWARVDERTARLEELRKGLVHGIARVAEPLLANVRREFAEAVVALRRPVLRLANEHPDLAKLAASWTLPVLPAIREAAERASRHFDGRLDLAVLALLQNHAALQAGLGDGTDVRTFLAGVMESTPGTVDVVVTGHSKGGALASTFALWLEETRKARDDDGWDPDDRAVVSCYSFAGPTAGNDHFAAYSNAKIGARCHRVVNRLDVVPHAWAVDDLGRIPKLYDEQKVAPLVGMELLLAAIVGATQTYKYCHIGDHVRMLPGQLASRPLFFGQFVHQHLQEYLTQLGVPVKAPFFFGVD